MKQWQIKIIQMAAIRAKERLEKKKQQTFLNIFNTGIVVDLEKVKRKGVEIIINLCKNGKNNYSK